MTSINWKFINFDVLTSVNLKIPLTIYRHKSYSDKDRFSIYIGLDVLTIKESQKEAIEYCEQRYKYHTKIIGDNSE